MAIHLTDRVVRELPAPASGNRITYDTEVAGFGVRVTAAGARSLILNFRVHGRERRITIGSFPDWPVKQAREQAKSLKRRIDVGEDPMAERHAERIAPTVAELCSRYLEDAARRKRPRSIIEDKSLINGEIIPALGKIKVAELHRPDVEKLFLDISKRAPIRANRMHSLIRAMFNKAIAWGLRAPETNPAFGIERNPENKRDRYLNAEELGRLLTVLTTIRNQQSANIIRLALLTGCRRGELLQAVWSQFDLTAGTWCKPASGTKQKKLHLVPLNTPALQLLTEMKVAADAENERRKRDGLVPVEHVFPACYGAAGGQGDLKRTWAAVCKAAGLSDLRFHDLRHAFASFLVSSGHNLPLIGQLLGHSTIATTARYAHLLLDPQREATERVGSIFTAAGKPAAEVVPMPGGRRP
jgi:integrase